VQRTAYVHRARLRTKVGSRLLGHGLGLSDFDTAGRPQLANEVSSGASSTTPPGIA
jgi:hypothetical protein